MTKPEQNEYSLVAQLAASIDAACASRDKRIEELEQQLSEACSLLESPNEYAVFEFLRKQSTKL